MLKEKRTIGKTSKDLTGLRFGRLTVLGFYEKRKGIEFWKCRCDCGGEKVIRKYALGRGTFSCGCLSRDGMMKKSRTHGDTKTSLYHRWGRMKERCFDPKHQGYHRYGGRGITVCAEWLVWENFKEWALTHGYSEELQLDRIDNDKGYSPDNCRWVCLRVQNRNRSDNVFLTHQGETLCQKDWEIRTHLPVGKRLAAGWSVDDAVSLSAKRGPHNERRL